ncbi:MAG: hypothetical protein Q7J47_00050 [Azoarcus sp.]|nr:hypothetical protein [Azoarcus sp.]
MKVITNGRMMIAEVVTALVAASQVQAAPIVYPSKGQSAQQQQKDDRECHAWAKSTTGIDPAAVAATPAPEPTPAVGGGERVAGAVRGAVIGGILGGGDGAAKGAGVGVVVGGAHARSNQRSKQAQDQARQQDKINTFNRAHSACMEGRGYTIR